MARVLPGRFVTAARAVLGWSRVELSKKSGVSISCLSDFETGKRTPLLANVAAVCRALGAAGIRFAVTDDEVIGVAWPEDGKMAGVYIAPEARDLLQAALVLEQEHADLTAVLATLDAQAERIEALEAAAKAVLARDAKWSPSKMPNDCDCISLSRQGEREYETGTCPHQLLRALLTPPATDQK